MSNIIWLAVALGVLALAWVVLGQRSQRSRPEAMKRVIPVEPTEPRPPAPSGPIEDLVPDPAAPFHWVSAAELPPVRQAALVAVFQHIPRPSRLMLHLVSTDLLSEASSAQLVDLIVSEPVIAGKLLSAVNSPLYGLETPVTSVAQAVIHLGLTEVRAICLRYAMMSSFAPDAPVRQPMLDRVWRASALASELAQYLTAELPIEDRGALVSAVLLSFLGRLAVVATTPMGLLKDLVQPDHLGRCAAEQAQLGLPASEIGRLLMAQWGLPASVIADASDADELLVRPYRSLDGARALPLALGYLCARLGELLAQGTLRSLQGFDLASDPSPTFTRVKACLSDPRMARLPLALKSPELAARLQRLMATLPGGGHRMS